MSSRAVSAKCGGCGFGPFSVRVGEAPFTRVRMALWWQCPACAQIWSTPINAIDGPDVQPPGKVGEGWDAVPIEHVRLKPPTQ